MIRPETSTIFTVMPCKGKSGWYVQLIWPNGQSEAIEGFASLIEAEYWAATDSSVWLRARIIARNPSLSLS